MYVLGSALDGVLHGVVKVPALKPISRELLDCIFQRAPLAGGLSAIVCSRPNHRGNWFSPHPSPPPISAPGGETRFSPLRNQVGENSPPQKGGRTVSPLSFVGEKFSPS